jgi:hypothetical protein
LKRKQGHTIDAETKNLLREAMINPIDYVLNVSRELTFKGLGAADNVAPILYKMKWSIASPLQGFFITCDNPLVRYVDPRTCHPIYGDHGFLNKTAEVIFPLSPKLLLLMSWNQNALELGTLKRNHVDVINRTLAAHSDSSSTARNK